ncbi:cytochrome P450, partial [Trametes gibbosa]
FIGNVMELFNHQNHVFLQHVVNMYGPVSKFHGFLGVRWLHVYNPRALHSLLVKDADSYGRGDAGNTASELTLGPGLFATIGTPHRKQRKLLNLVFSAVHMHNMTPFLHEIASKLQEAIKICIASGAKELDIAGWMGRTTLELIGQGGLEYLFDLLMEETSNEYTEAVKALVPTLNAIEWTRLFLPYVKYLGPIWLRRKILDMVPNAKVQRLKNITDIMYKCLVEIYTERKVAAACGDESLILKRVGVGKGIMSIM